MSSSGIGVPQIDPRDRTVWQDSHPAPDRQDRKDRDDDEAGQARSDRAPPKPGTGEIVDKVV